MPAKLIAIIAILRLESTGRRKDFGRLLVGQSQGIEGIPEQILVAVSEISVHLLVGNHVVGKVQNRKIQAIVASFVKDHLP